MRQHPHLVHPRQQQHYVGQTNKQQLQQSNIGLITDEPKKHKRPLAAPYITHERSFSSSEEDLRSTPEFEGKNFPLFLISIKREHNFSFVLIFITFAE